MLTRKRLDIEETKQLAAMEQERNLAQLRTQAQQASGETELLKTRGGLAELGQRMELARSADVRAGEAHGLGMRTGEQQLQQSAELFPLQKADLATGTAVKRAEIGRIGASTRAANLQAQKTQQELAFLNKPLNDAQVAGMVQGLYGDAGLGVLTSMAPPGTIKSMGDLISFGNVMAKGFPDEIKDRMIDQLTTRIASLPSGSPEAAQLERQRAMMLQNKGISLGRNVSGKELVTEGIAGAIQTLEAYSGQRDRNPEVVKQLYRHYDMTQKLESVHRDPTEAQTAQAMRLLSIEREFAPIAKQLVEAESTRQGLSDPQQIQQLIRLKQQDLVRQYGTPEAFRATLQTTPQGVAPRTTAAPPSAAGDIPVTPGAEAVRQQQRARIGNLAEAGRTGSIANQAAQEFAVFERNATSTGLAQIPDALRPQVRAAYVQARTANPQATPIQILQQVMEALR